METLLEQLSAQSFWDWLTVVASLAYVYLAARDNNWCWVFAAVASTVWAYQSFVVYNLISDGMLQVFYLVMAGVGLRRWQRKPEPAPLPTDVLDAAAIRSEPAASITRMTLAEHAYVCLGGLAAGYLLHLFASEIFAGAATLPDGITTAFSVITTFLLINRKLENWLYWVVIDLAYVGIYLRTGAVLFAVLMVLYTGMAVYGFFRWRTQ
ncbi:MAG: nicotinamide riboside transporter PnuC, partial [Bacteroidota bacterium]